MRSVRTDRQRGNLFWALILHNYDEVKNARCGCCALSVSKMAATMYAYWDRF
ncbi:MAG: hypothetical protein N6V49_01970 [Serratia symbiotica]|nr:hypothetical protein [Serratia symbiotica]